MIIRVVAARPLSHFLPKTLERLKASPAPLFYSKSTYSTRLPPFLRCSYPNPTLESRFNAFSLPLPPSLNPVKPYLQSEWDSILKGWLCSAISVYCLSNAVPKIGKLSSVLCSNEPNQMVKECLVLVVLALVRSTASYFQQVFLWEAALRSTHKIRVDAFDRVLQRDLGFFEGSKSFPAGDVAHRITAEASDVADTLYALLNSTVPNTLQLLAMATQMVAVSPVLSLISAVVIPFTCLVIAYLGERLRMISQKAHFSVGRLSAYLNEILPSMLVVKANNAELNESLRFQRLAHDNLTNHLKKRKMKALIPHIIQFTYIGGLLLLCAGSVVVSGSSFNASTMVSFIMSLALIIEPIQVTHDI